MKINEFESGMQIKIPLLVKSVVQGVTNKGSAYLSLVLQDDSGSIDAKFWDVDTNLLNEITSGNVFMVSGNVIQYKNVNQLKVEDMQVIENVDMSLFVKTSRYSKEELTQTLKLYLDEIKDENIKKVVIELLKQYHQDYFEYPAAMSNHHNYVRGLGEHVITMLKVAKALQSIYPYLNKSLLYGGIILHDLGKVIELSGPIATKYTTEGTLLGHISIVLGKIEKVVEQYQLHSESIMLLKHIVLSHHGKLEFGSPVLPMIPEAEVIHYIDNIDARMNAIQQAYENVKEEEFTQRIFALEGRMFYKAKGE